MAPMRAPSGRLAAGANDAPPIGIRTWVAAQVKCHPNDLREIRAIDLAPGVREFRYLRSGQSAVVATLARQHPGRYRLRATWSGGTVEASVRGVLSS